MTTCRSASAAVVRMAVAWAEDVPAPGPDGAEVPQWVGWPANHCGGLGSRGGTGSEGALAAIADSAAPAIDSADWKSLAKGR